MTAILLKLLLIIGVYIIIIHLFHWVVSKWLSMKRRTFLSFETVNDQHERGDKLLRYLAVVILIAGFVFHLVTDFDNEYWFLQPHFIVAFFFIARQLWKSFMEMKSFSDKRVSTYTLLETGINILLFFALFTSDFWLF
ncbi:DUF4181 domain-containing protein [Rossellomorea sp. LjRoot5]|uniref:DUF4181 domain-containing protein n=1 Tax=Rossellomorea sp. LjRoot5 TaxID=3342331 RepID=UPI003ECEB50D